MKQYCLYALFGNSFEKEMNMKIKMKTKPLGLHMQRMSGNLNFKFILT